MRRRKSFSLIIGVTLLSLLVSLLAACGGQASTPAPEAAAPTEAAAPPTEAPAPAAEATEAAEPAEAAAGAPVEITFWSWVPNIEAEVNDFNASQSEIKVNYVNAGGGNDQYAKLKVAIEAQTDIPDVVQIEFQHLPSYIVRGDLLNLTDYGANEIKDQFVPWTWAQVSQGDGVYAYPQDAGPMIMMCNQELLDKHGVAVPTTWDEFAAAAAKLHEADPNVYLSNFTADPGYFFGLLWQSGAHPFVVDGENITINFTSPEAMRVAELWGDLISSGNLSPVDTFTNDWNTALANGSIACWTSGAWGPALIESAAKDQAGQWRVLPMPQWTAGGKVNGNWGGSTSVVMKATAHPKEAETFARWLNTDPQTVLDLTVSAALFPVTQPALSNPEWAGYKPDFWGGQETHKVMAEVAQQVDVSFAWSPFQDFVYTTYADE
ncbi:MAG TPA: extracellular solute-binding protein, partial [Anaerolineae bacterium]|nr:extracellular solute-binding protein [Anaerolineae bacterium]